MGGANASCDFGGGGETYHSVPPPKPVLDASGVKKREGVSDMGTKPLKALRGYRASKRGSKKPQTRL